MIFHAPALAGFDALALGDEARELYRFANVHRQRAARDKLGELGGADERGEVRVHLGGLASQVDAPAAGGGWRTSRQARLAPRR
jgi:hypothetical protein